MSRTLMPDPATAKSARPAMAAPATQRRAVRAVMRDPEVVCSSAAARGSTGRSERSDSGRAERRGGARDDGHGNGKREETGATRVISLARRANPGGSRPFPATTITDKRNEMSPRDLATRARARGIRRVPPSRSGVCSVRDNTMVGGGLRTPRCDRVWHAESGGFTPTPTPEGVFHFLLSEGRVGEQASERPACKIFAHISVINFCT